MQQQQPSQIGEITLISRDSETLDIWDGPGSRGPPVARSSGSVGSVSLVTNIVTQTLTRALPPTSNLERDHSG